MGKMNKLRSGCRGEQPSSTGTAVDGLIWVCNGYGDAVGNICTMWGCFYFLEHFLDTPIVIPLDCEIRPRTGFTVSPLCFWQQTLLNSALQSCGCKLLHPLPYCPISSNNIPSSVDKQTPPEEVHRKNSYWKWTMRSGPGRGLLHVSYSTSACRSCLDEMPACLSNHESFPSFPVLMENAEDKRESKISLNLL